MELSENVRTWKKGVGLVAVLLILCITVPCKAAAVTEAENTNYFKLLSSIEYNSKQQFRSQAETLFTVSEKSLGGDRVQYSISGQNINFDDQAQGDPIDLSFVVNRQSGQMSGADRNAQLMQLVNNRCIDQLTRVAEEDLGRKWQQILDLSFLGEWMGGELQFEVSAIKVQSELYGELWAVRALSKPFNVQVAIVDEQPQTAKCQIRSAYLFDAQVESIYMSLSVFEAKTKIDGKQEKLRHEVATYRTDADGTSLDLTGLGKKFAKFVRKVGLTRKALKIKQEGELPGWAKSEALRAAQIANLCAAVTCEGSLNPVATICIPAAKAVEMQSFGALVTAGKVGTVSTMLTTGIPAISSMKIAAAPAIMGMSATTAGAVAGGTAGGVAAAGGGGSGGSSAQSPD